MGVSAYHLRLESRKQVAFWLLPIKILFFINRQLIEAQDTTTFVSLLPGTKTKHGVDMWTHHLQFGYRPQM